MSFLNKFTFLYNSHRMHSQLKEKIYNSFIYCLHLNFVKSSCATLKVSSPEDHCGKWVSSDGMIDVT